MGIRHHREIIAAVAVLLVTGCDWDVTPPQSDNASVEAPLLTASRSLIVDPVTGVTHDSDFTVEVLASGVGPVSDLAIDGSGNVIGGQLVSCGGAVGSLFSIDPTGLVTTIASTPRGQGLAVDVLSPDLFYSAECQSRVLRITPAGGVSTFVNVGAFTEGVAVRDDGTVFISRRDRILEVVRDAGGNPVSVSTLLTFPGVPGLQGKYDAIAFEILPNGSTGDLFVANEGPGGGLIRVNTNTGAASRFSSFASSRAEAVYVAPLTASAITGPRHVFVVNTGGVFRISPDGSTVEIIAIVAQGGNTIGVAVDDVGNVYFADRVLGNIYRLTPSVPITIDIRPGADPNTINCRVPQIVIPVAILTTSVAAGDPADFDATVVDHTTVMFEGAAEAHISPQTGEPRRHEADVDGDGDLDLLFHFRLGDTSLTCQSTEGTLTGQTFAGAQFEGTDGILMINPG